ncbi:PRC-barrel domain containing protein [Methanophagales archaeon]|nr:MAG: PRC-barrel domain containing protein [Methanophagales archaeon]
MKKISAQKMSGKMVMDLDGGEIGILHNVVADAATGMLSELVVKPVAELDTSGFKEEDEYIVIPFQVVKAIKDVIIVDREEMRERA